VTAGEKAERLGRLAEAFDVAGKIGPAAPMLALRLSAEIETNPEVLQELLDSLRAVFAGPVILIPHGWTQEQIDAEAVRLAVKEEREACAAIAKAHHDALDPDDDSTARNEAAVIEGEIRARGSK